VGEVEKIDLEVSLTRCRTVTVCPAWIGTGAVFPLHSALGPGPPILARLGRGRFGLDGM
jgi:hypothetical protein